MEQPYSVHLEAYEGPLDLLLDLIRKQEINIYDIPIAQITGQYLEYVQRNLERLNAEAAGEFLLMAATLIHIKVAAAAAARSDAHVRRARRPADGAGAATARTREVQEGCADAPAKTGGAETRRGRSRD